MADEKTAPPGIVHKIAAPVGAALKDLGSSKILSGVGTGIKWTVDKATLVTGVQHAASALKISFSPTTWFVGAFWVLVLILGYLWGHHEEAKKYTVVFSRLSACMAAAKPVAIPVCAPAPEAVAPTAPAPAVEAAPAPSAPAKASRPHKKKPPSSVFGSWFGG
jgi:hypothetical protein